jgi:hypothetical protein
VHASRDDAMSMRPSRSAVAVRAGAHAHTLAPRTDIRTKYRYCVQGAIKTVVRLHSATTAGSTTDYASRGLRARREGGPAESPAVSCATGQGGEGLVDQPEPSILVVGQGVLHG